MKNIKLKYINILIAFIGIVIIPSCVEKQDSFVPGAIPVIESVTPLEGGTGTVITITGQNFNSNPGENIVAFNGNIASVTDASATSLTVTLPAGTLSGPVTMSTNGIAAIGPDFVVPIVQFAYTSFEEPVGVDENYVDAGDVLSDHYLVNVDGQPPVEYVSTGGELGFRTFYISRDAEEGDNGLSDGDEVGVTNNLSDVGAYADGDQGYIMDDLDGGILELQIEKVVIPAETGVLLVEMNYLFRDTGWEDSDYVKISVLSASGQKRTLIHLDGDDIDDGLDPDPNIWHKLKADISFFKDEADVQLLIEFKCNSSSEDIYLDNIKFLRS